MKINPYILAIFSGIMLWLGFPPNHFPGFMFVGFVPLLWLTHKQYVHTTPNYYALFKQIALAILLWNILTLWWIKNAAWIGFIAPTIFHTLCMSGLFVLHAQINRRFNNQFIWLALPSLWLTFEYFHLKWELDFPWLNLGNAFAGYPRWIQWYQYLGQSGGTLWVWWMNIALFQLLLLWFEQKVSFKKIKLWKRALFAMSICFIPLIFSNYLFKKPLNALQKAEVVVVQPSFDPYGTKFDEETFADQLDTLIALSKAALGQKTSLVVWPETALPGYYQLGDQVFNWQDAKLEPLWNSHPNLSLLIGASAVKVVDSTNYEPFVSRPIQNGLFINHYNAALFYKNKQLHDTYFKTKLVSGVEKMPFASVLAPLGDAIVDLGGTASLLGTQKERTNFDKQPLVIAPVICYESIFPEFVSQYTAKKANLIAIITNDGWWDKTAGYQQHLLFAQLRAIEAGRCVVRSANTGISAIIDAKGIIVKQTQWCEQTAFAAEVPLHTHQTFYVTYGDVIGRTSIFISSLLLLLLFMPQNRPRL